MDPRTLFVGDVHGCARELERLLERARPTRVVLLGDVFTLGPDPLGVWKLVQAYGAEAVLGNHDTRMLDEWTVGEKLPAEAFRWLGKQPWMLHTASWVAVHAGVRPRRWRETRKSQAVGLRELPIRGGRPWWERYEGKRLVLHGHHSRLGLSDRRPFTLGLDTGCVKGGPLTGYLLEEDRLIGVPAFGRRVSWLQSPIRSLISRHRAL